MGTLQVTYYDTKNPGSLGGVEKLERATGQPVKDWLITQDTYTLHKPIRRRFSGRRVTVSGIDDQWQADLVDLSTLQKENNNFKYLLTCIDVFSKYALVEPIKQKTGKTLVKAFENILKKSKHKPRALQTDKGSKFKNKVFQSWLLKQKIHFLTTHNEETKASIVERFNRTIKSRMWHCFTSKNSRRYIDIPKNFAFSYNHFYHRSIKQTPASVTFENQEKVWQILCPDDNLPKIPTLKENDTVRISKVKSQLHKGYFPNWSEEIFAVSKAISGNPSSYKLKDLEGEELEGNFYSEELQKTSKQNDIYRVETVVDKQKHRKKTQYLIKWLGYPSKSNSWVDAIDII